MGKNLKTMTTQTTIDFLKNLHVGLNIDTSNSHGRVVKDIKITENKKDFTLIIKIGQNTTIGVDKQMLTSLYNSSIHNNGVYNKHIFQSLYPQKLNNHPCYVHVVGMLFVKAGLAKVDGSRSFRLCNYA